MKGFYVDHRCMAVTRSLTVAWMSAVTACGDCPPDAILASLRSFLGLILQLVEQGPEPEPPRGGDVVDVGGAGAVHLGNLVGQADDGRLCRWQASVVLLFDQDQSV